ncbi:MAG: hypothetical protein MUP86_02465 [Dehalococcoidia bacterium]|nr:hypothetical protein [Dehalococcoidia bacterium]
MTPRRTTKQLIEQTVTISTEAMRADFQGTRLAVDRLTIAVMGDGQGSRGIQGDVQDMSKALFGNSTVPDNPGLCERVRILATWKDTWDRLKWVVIGGVVVIGLGVVVDILMHVAGAVP